MFLWFSAYLIKYIKTLRICMHPFFEKCKGTSFFACQKASLTIEAAVVVPITAGVLACVLFLFRIIQVQVNIEECMVYVGRKLAVESCISDSTEALFLTAEAHMIDAMGKRVVIDQYVRHGRWGVYLGSSEFEGENIILCAEYDVKLPVEFFELDSIHLASVNQFRKWRGDNASNGVDTCVYVTESGRVYHAGLDCRVLDLSVRTAYMSEIDDIRGLDGQKYYPCDGCKTNMDVEAVVYYTQYGTCYHKNVSCSALKRNVKKILKSEIGNKKACSFCFP